MHGYLLLQSFTTDPKIQVLPENIQRRFLMLVMLAHDIKEQSLTHEEIACALRISLEELKKTLSLLREKELISEEEEPLPYGGYMPETSHHFKSF